MPTIVKFIATHIGGFKERYTCNTQGDLTGAYVPLAQYTQADDERGKLEAEVERLQAENERLTFVYLADTKISGALVADNERLRAELAERERQIVALGKARLDALAFGEVGGG